MEDYFSHEYKCISSKSTLEVEQWDNNLSLQGKDCSRRKGRAIHLYTTYDLFQSLLFQKIVIKQGEQGRGHSFYEPHMNPSLTPITPILWWQEIK